MSRHAVTGPRTGCCSRVRSILTALPNPGAGVDGAGRRRDLLPRFLAAADGGDLSRLPADDVVTRDDGGGRVRAALLPVVGRARVAALATGVLLVVRYGS